MQLFAVTPRRVCGLKAVLGSVSRIVSSVTPRRVCGLKVADRYMKHGWRRSHPRWVCGLKALIAAVAIEVYKK